MLAAMTPQQRTAVLDQMPAWMRAQMIGNSRNASPSGSPQLHAQQQQQMQQMQQQQHSRLYQQQQQSSSSNSTMQIQLPPSLSNNSNNNNGPSGFRNSHASRTPSHLSSTNQDYRDASPGPSTFQAPSHSSSSKTTEKPPVDVNKLDVDSMMDATTYGGIDLKVCFFFYAKHAKYISYALYTLAQEEEYTMEFSNTSGSVSKRGSVSKEAPFLNQHRLKKEVQKIGMRFPEWYIERVVSYTILHKKSHGTWDQKCGHQDSRVHFSSRRVSGQ